MAAMSGIQRKVEVGQTLASTFGRDYRSN